MTRPEESHDQTGVCDASASAATSCSCDSFAGAAQLTSDEPGAHQQSQSLEKLQEKELRELIPKKVAERSLQLRNFCALLQQTLPSSLVLYILEFEQIRIPQNSYFANQNGIERDAKRMVGVFRGDSDRTPVLLFRSMAMSTGTLQALFSNQFAFEYVLKHIRNLATWVVLDSAVLASISAETCPRLRSIDISGVQLKPDQLPLENAYFMSRLVSCYPQVGSSSFFELPPQHPSLRILQNRVQVLNTENVANIRASKVKSLHLQLIADQQYHDVVQELLMLPGVTSLSLQTHGTVWASVLSKDFTAPNLKHLTIMAYHHDSIFFASRLDRFSNVTRLAFRGHGCGGALDLSGISLLPLQHLSLDVQKELSIIAKQELLYCSQLSSLMLECFDTVTHESYVEWRQTIVEPLVLLGQLDKLVLDIPCEANDDCLFSFVSPTSGSRLCHLRIPVWGRIKSRTFTEILQNDRLQHIDIVEYAYPSSSSEGQAPPCKDDDESIVLDFLPELNLCKERFTIEAIVIPLEQHGVLVGSRTQRKRMLPLAAIRCIRARAP